jgi:cytochrome c oxidase accessory protein FixG
MSTTPNPTDKSQAKQGDVEKTLYAKREKIYPREVHGIFAMWRTISVFVLLGIYYITPWLQYEGRQAVILDLPARKFYIFGITFWPQDFFYFAVLLIVAALSLFFFTAIAGRLWCGYACPQTVWTEIFMWIERKIEGDRPQRMKLDKAPWASHKVFVKSTKHFVWITLAAWTGFTFVGYFTPIMDLGARILDLSLGPWEWFWIIFYSFATWGNAGFLREQVCIYMCPYARFQSAMFDKDTLIISYDEKRGEPRGSRKRGADPKERGLGDCIDCSLCVQVCPTGIDIRDGLQYQCIACSACIDVCNGVMDKMGYPRNLIRYTTENADNGKPTHILRPRVILYAAMLLGIMVALGWAIATRVPLEMDVIRDRNRLYLETDEGLIENVYTLKIINMDESAHTYSLDVQGIDGVQLVLKDPDIRVDAGKVRDVALRVQADPYDLKSRSTEISFTLQATDNEDLVVEEASRFLGPTGVR